MTRSAGVRILSVPLVALTLALTSPSVASPSDAASGARLLDLMAQARSDTDLGQYPSAIATFTSVIDDPDTTPALRAEALVRLGVARRGGGDPEGAVDAFQRALATASVAADTKALLVQALGGAMPDAERWSEIAPRVAFAPDRSQPSQPTLAIVWPEVTPFAKRPYRGQALALDLKDANLGDTFRLFADITGFNIVVFPGVHGKVTFKAQEAWDRCLDAILAPHGYAYQWEDNVVLIGRPSQLPRARRYTGERIDVAWGTGNGPSRTPDRDLKEGLAELAAAGGARLAVDPAVNGRVVLKLKRVRWDHAFDIVASVNALEWTRDADTFNVFPRKTGTGR